MCVCVCAILLFVGICRFLELLSQTLRKPANADKYGIAGPRQTVRKRRATALRHDTIVAWILLHWVVDDVEIYISRDHRSVYCRCPINQRVSNTMVFFQNY